MSLSLPELADAPDLVPAEIADAAVAAARFEVTLLIDAVRRAEADADELERQVALTDSSGVDEPALLARVAAILDQLARDAADRRQVAVRSGRREADVRREAGRMEFDRIRQVSLGDEAVEPSLVVLGPQPVTVSLASEAPIDLGTGRRLGRVIHEVVDPVGDPEVSVAPAPLDDPPGAPSADLEGLDLSELAELVPILEAMLRGEVAEPDAADGAVAADGPADGDGVLGDAEDRFQRFWDADAEPDVVRRGASTALSAITLLSAPVLVGLAVLILLVAWIA